MEPITLGLGALALWSIIRPGWVYELFDRPIPYSPPSMLETQQPDSKGLTRTPNESDANGAHSSTPTSRRPIVLLTEEEQSEAAAAIRCAVRKKAAVISSFENK